eukprot:3873136-Prymnesium_polylepis.1
MRGRRPPLRPSGPALRCGSASGCALTCIRLVHVDEDADHDRVADGVDHDGADHEGADDRLVDADLA